MKRNSDIRTICYKCKVDYESTGEYYIHRADSNQTDKDICFFCQDKYGYEYEVIPKNKREPVIKRGDIYYADLNPVVGSEQGERRPVIVVQNNKGNKYSPTIIVTPITGNLRKNPLPTHVRLSRACGLEKDSLALTEQIRAIDRSRLSDYIGSAGNRAMSQIDRALLISVGLTVQ